VTGQAQRPEAKANQPLVRGHGPWRMSIDSPPPPAIAIQIQPSVAPSTDNAFRQKSLRGCEIALKLS